MRSLSLRSRATRPTVFSILELRPSVLPTTRRRRTMRSASSRRRGFEPKVRRNLSSTSTASSTRIRPASRAIPLPGRLPRTSATPPRPLNVSRTYTAVPLRNADAVAHARLHPGLAGRCGLAGTIDRAVGVYFPADGNFYTVGGRSSDVAGSDFQHVLQLFTHPQ